MSVKGVEYEMICSDSSKGFTKKMNDKLKDGFLPMGQHTHSMAVTNDGVHYISICMGLARDEKVIDASDSIPSVVVDGACVKED